MAISTLTLFLLSQTVFRPRASPYVNISNVVFIGVEGYSDVMDPNLLYFFGRQIVICYIYFKFIYCGII